MIVEATVLELLFRILSRICSILNVCTALERTMIRYFHGKIKHVMLALLPISLLNARGGVNLRVFPGSIQHNGDAKAILEYEPTKRVPFISCKCEPVLFGCGDNWKMVPNEEFVIKPSRITNRYHEFNNISTTLASLGRYVLKSITIKQGDYSYYFTAEDDRDYHAAKSAYLENRLKFNYVNNLYSFVYCCTKDNEELSAANNANSRVPLRIAYDVGQYPHGKISIPLPFNRIEIIDLHFCKSDDCPSGAVFYSHDDITGRIEQLIFTNPPKMECNSTGSDSMKIEEWGLKETPLGKTR